MLWWITAIMLCARICANIGLFAIVTLIVPVTEYLGELTGSSRHHAVYSISNRKTPKEVNIAL